MKFSIVLLLFALSSACAVKKELVPTGGSRADGIVRLSYTTKLFESPVIDMRQGISAATARCKLWGYQSAEPFGGSNSVCNQYSMGDCVSWMVTMEYQCLTGAGSAAVNAVGGDPINQSPRETASAAPSQETLFHPTGKMAFEAETSAMGLGCVARDGSRPIANLMGTDANIENYQLTCSRGTLYLQCQSGHCVPRQ